MVCVCCGFVLFFSGQNVVQLHVGYSKYPKEQLQSFREDVIFGQPCSRFTVVAFSTKSDVHSYVAVVTPCENGGCQK